MSHQTCNCFFPRWLTGSGSLSDGRDRNVPREEITPPCGSMLALILWGMTRYPVGGARVSKNLALSVGPPGPAGATPACLSEASDVTGRRVMASVASQTVYLRLTVWSMTSSQWGRGGEEEV